MKKSQEVLEYIVRALVSNPDDVKVNSRTDDMGVLLTLDVHPDDMGKIIGRSGNTAKAIRSILRVVGMSEQSRVNLKINEPEGTDSNGEVKAPVEESTPETDKELLG